MRSGVRFRYFLPSFASKDPKTPRKKCDMNSYVGLERIISYGGALLRIHVEENLHRLNSHRQSGIGGLKKALQMLNILSAISFLAFVASGLIATAGQRWAAEPTRRSLTNLFIGIVLFVTFGAGFSQRDMWPFSSWAMMVGLTPPATRSLPTLRIVGVDANGNEYDIDYRAWHPLSLEELYTWMGRHFFKMGPVSQDHVASYLLQVANHGRERALSQGSLGLSNPWLGPLTAPTHVLHPAIWSHADAVPRNPFVGLRIYQESWDLETSESAPTKNMRALAYEYLHW